MDTLGRIFGSDAKVKIMRLFLFNAGIIYDLEEISKRTKVPKDITEKEIGLLKKVGLLSARTHIKTFVKKPRPAKKSKKKGKRKTVSRVRKEPKPPVVIKKRIPGWTLNPNFRYLRDLQSMLINTSVLKEDEITKRLGGVGKVKLILVAGVFIQSPDSRIDILIVGDKIDRSKLSVVVKRMEAEIGKELRYTFLTPQDFKYRMSIYDKLVRDILDYPHKVLFDRLGIKLGF